MEGEKGTKRTKLAHSIESLNKKDFLKAWRTISRKRSSKGCRREKVSVHFQQIFLKNETECRK